MRRLACLMFLLLGGCQLPGEFPRTLDAVRDTEPAQREMHIETWTTDTGSKVLFMPTDALPMLDVQLTFAAGSSRDGQAPGLASLTSALIGEGAEGLTVDDIARGFENLGANFSTSSYRDMGVISLRTLSESRYLDDAMSLFTRVIGSPTFPEQALTRVRTQRLRALERQKQVPGPQVRKAFNRALFGDHPYGHPSSGTQASISAIGREQIQAFWQRYYNAGNLVIAMVGDISRKRAEALAAAFSKALPEGEPAPELARANGLSAPVREHLSFDSAQTHVVLGDQLIWRGHPDYVPLYVGNHILGGGGLSSILMKEVRQEKGYVYSIGSGLSVMSAAGPFTVSLQTANENAPEALALTRQLISDFVAKGPTADQVARAKDTLTGRFARSTASNSAIVGQLASIGFYDLPLDYLDWFQGRVNAVTAEDVKQAFQKHLDPDRMAIVSIGPEKPVEADGEEE